MAPTVLLPITCALLTLATFAESRAVNISNTWMLPEEGFPVFYRYFRDRISWYEADAVCQFHHANLVTADTSSEYDAIRAYLKELDITDNVWIGLSKSSDKPKFLWSDSHPMNSEGHWRESIPVGSDPLCVTMDPVADFLWKPMPCGGPEVASFICELPVPSWATGPTGCLLTELPSLTVLYVPEQMALELTSDCGLDGTKRIACKGNADRDEILRQLTCAMSSEEFEEKSSSKPPDMSTATFEENSINSKTPHPWIWTSNTVETDYGTSTRHRRETEETVSPSALNPTTELSSKSDLSSKGYIKVEVVSFSSEENRLQVGVSSTASSTDTSVGVDTTIASSVSGHRDNSSGTPIEGLHEPNRQTERTVTVAATATAAVPNVPAVPADGKTAETFGEDIAEFPSAINQGQLFSIIENGTMFDIIELNDTAPDDAKKTASAKNKLLNLTQPTSATPESTSQKNLYTTVVYVKEPPSASPQVTNKSPRKLDKLSKTQFYKKSDPKKANYLSGKESRKQKMLATDKNEDLNKEVEMAPVIPSTSIILNRTFRKEVPVKELLYEERHNTPGPINLETPKILNLSITNTLLDIGNHEHVEIKLPINNNENITIGTLLVTTKRLDNKGIQKKDETVSKEKQAVEIIDLQEDTSITLIDPKIDLLNKDGKVSNETETFITKPIKIEKVTTPVKLLVDSESTSAKSSTTYLPPTETEPVTPQRPNRQRQLTRPQRKSFYPYFFSRVLG